MIYDFNYGTALFNLDQSNDKLDDNFPNIAATAPILFKMILFGD